MLNYHLGRKQYLFKSPLWQLYKSQNLNPSIWFTINSKLFTAYCIKQLKSKPQSISELTNMLVKLPYEPDYNILRLYSYFGMSYPKIDQIKLSSYQKEYIQKLRILSSSLRGNSFTNKSNIEILMYQYLQMYQKQLLMNSSDDIDDLIVTNMENTHWKLIKLCKIRQFYWPLEDNIYIIQYLLTEIRKGWIDLNIFRLVLSRINSTKLYNYNILKVLDNILNNRTHASNIDQKNITIVSNYKIYYLRQLLAKININNILNTLDDSFDNFIKEIQIICDKKISFNSLIAIDCFLRQIQKQIKDRLNRQLSNHSNSNINNWDQLSKIKPWSIKTSKMLGRKLIELKDHYNLQEISYLWSYQLKNITSSINLYLKNIINKQLLIPLFIKKQNQLNQLIKICLLVQDYQSIHKIINKSLTNSKNVFEILIENQYYPQYIHFLQKYSNYFPDSIIWYIHNPQYYHKCQDCLKFYIKNIYQLEEAIKLIQTNHLNRDKILSYRFITDKSRNTLLNLQNMILNRINFQNWMQFQEWKQK